MKYDYKNTKNYVLLQEELSNCITKSYLKDIEIKIDHCIGFFNAESNLRVVQFKRNIDILNINESKINIEFNFMSNILFKLFVDDTNNLRDFIEKKCKNILPQYNIKKIDLFQGNVLRDIYNHYYKLLNECKNEKLSESRIFKFNASVDDVDKIYLYDSENKLIISFSKNYCLVNFPNNKIISSISSSSILTYYIDLDNKDSKDFIKCLNLLGIPLKEIKIN